MGNSLTLFNVLLSSTLLTFVCYLIETFLVTVYSDRFINLQVTLFIFLNIFLIISGVTTIMIIFK